MAYLVEMRGRRFTGITHLLTRFDLKYAVLCLHAIDVSEFTKSTKAS